LLEAAIDFFMCNRSDGIAVMLAAVDVFWGTLAFDWSAVPEE